MARVVFVTFMTYGWGLCLLLLTAAISGCVTDGSGRVESDTNIPVFDDDTGAILGQALSDEDLPVAGAEAGIVALGISSKSDESGVFTLNNVPPGSHLVTIVALGFEPSSRMVEVTAGRATDLVEFRLTSLPSNEPYARLLIYKAQLSGVMWKLTPTCIYTDVNPLVKTCGGLRFGNIENPLGGNITAGCDVCEMHTSHPDFIGFTSEWQSIVGELDWTQQSGATGKGFLLDINAPNITRGTGGSINQADPYTWQDAKNKAPIQIRVDKDGLAARGVAETDWNNPPREECWGDFDDNPDDEELSRNNCDWFYRVFPAAYDAGIGEDGFGPDYGIMLENTATIYFAYFIRMKAPADYTSIQS